jgi:hypothetical protein
VLFSHGFVAPIGRAPVLQSGGYGFESRQIHWQLMMKDSLLPTRSGSLVGEHLGDNQEVAGSNPALITDKVPIGALGVGTPLTPPCQYGEDMDSTS